MERAKLMEQVAESVASEHESYYDNDDDFEDATATEDDKLSPPPPKIERRSSFLNKAIIKEDENDEKFRQEMQNMRNSMLRAPSLINHSIFDDQSLEGSINADDILDDSGSVSPGKHDPLAHFLGAGSVAGDSIELDDPYQDDEWSNKD